VWPTTPIVGSTQRAGDLGDQRWRELLEVHDQAAARWVEAFHGRPVKATGDGILATFDSPARAIRCAAALGEDLHGMGIQIRAGLHTGEIELRHGDVGDVGGMGVHIAARVMAAAGAGAAGGTGRATGGRPTTARRPRPSNPRGTPGK
jgi:class 3 adenylate cyclase